MTRSENKPSIAAVKDLMGANHDALRMIMQDLLQEMLEGEMTEALGAAKSERVEARIGYRSGHYNRTLITRVGKLELRVPQDRDVADALLTHWPDDDGEEYVIAMKKCLDAIMGVSPANHARQAFIAAANEAGMRNPTGTQRGSCPGS